MPWNNFRGQGYGKGYDGKGYDGRRPYSQPYYPGPHGKGSSKGLSDLLGQLQSEIAAQHQLQAIAGVLMPGGSAGSLAAPPQQAHDLTVQNTNELKAIKDMLAAMQSDKKSASAAVPDEDVSNPKISAMLNQIRADLVQLKPAAGSVQSAHPVPQGTRSDLEAELAALQAQIAAAGKPRAALSSVRPAASTSGRLARLRARAPKEIVEVSKAQHLAFYKDILQKRTSMRSEAVDLTIWCQQQASKWGDDDFQNAVEKTSPNDLPDDASDEQIVKSCFLKWVRREDGSGASD